MGTHYHPSPQFSAESRFRELEAGRGGAQLAPAAAGGLAQSVSPAQLLAPSTALSEQVASAKQCFKKNCYISAVA